MTGDCAMSRFIAAPSLRCGPLCG